MATKHKLNDDDSKIGLPLACDLKTLGIGARYRDELLARADLIASKLNPRAIDGDDLMQELWFILQRPSVLAGLSEMTPAQRFKYLQKILLNIALKTRRYDRRRSFNPIDFDANYTTPPSSRLKEVLEWATHQLSSTRRQMLTRFCQGETRDHISESTGLSYHQVCRVLNKIFEKMRDQWDYFL